MIQIIFEQFLSMGIVFIMGLAIATSPCLFPLLPLFLLKNLQGEDSRRRSLLITGILTAGILAAIGLYSILSIIVWELTNVLFMNSNLLLVLSYILMIILGVIVASHKLREKIGLSRISMKTTPGNPKGLLGVFGVGASYTLIAIPCTGALLVTGIGIIAVQTDLFLSLIMYILLCFGIAIPYMSIALVTGELRIRLATKMANSQRNIEILVGMILIIVGVYFLIFEGLPYL